jgi:hypothetical protein
MRYNRACQGISLLALLLVSAPALGAPAATIALRDARLEGGVTCPRAEGIFVALLLPSTGSVLLATKPFPGAERVGEIEDRQIHFTLPGLGTRGLAVHGSPPEPIPIWGMVDRTLEIGGRSGCFSFGDRDFTSVDDLKTYLHWVLRDLFFRLRSENDAEPLALRIADRTVALQVSSPGLLPAVLRVREAGMVGLRLPGSVSTHYFQPVILDEDTERVAVKVLAKEGAFFGEGTAREVAFVISERDVPGVTSTEPPLEIRPVAIE